MDVYGIDFTSRPRKPKPITCRHCRLEGDLVRALAPSDLTSFTAFEAALDRPGPWIAGIDFPFGQARRFVDDVRWPTPWKDYVRHADGLGKAGFEAILNAYRKAQPEGAKEHRRRTDIIAGALSPQKLYFIPVGKMFFQGAPRLLHAGVEIPAPPGWRPRPHRGRGVPRRPRTRGNPGKLQERRQEEADREPARGAQQDPRGADVGGAVEPVRRHRGGGRPGIDGRPDRRQFGCAALRSAGRVGVAEPKLAIPGRHRNRSTGGLDLGPDGRQALRDLTGTRG